MKRLLLLVPFLALVTVVHAQQYRIASSSTMSILGTSNLHDWETKVTSIDGFVQYSRNDDGALEIVDARLTIPVNSIQSDKGKKMDKLTYDALNAETHKSISFRLKNATYTDGSNSGSAKVTGDLTVNGVTKSVSFSATTTDDNAMSWHSEVPMKMTDFNIDPPTALLGALKTGDEITVKFDINLE